MGDLHIKEQTWNNRPEIRHDAYNAFEQLVTYCVTNKRSLTLLGDIFNTARPNSRDVTVFRRGVEKLCEVGLPVYVIQGQHDWSDPPWPLALLSTGPWLSYVHGKVFEPIPGLKMFGMDRSTSVEARTMLEQIPKDVTVLGCHQLIRQAFSLDGAWDFDLAWLPEHINMVLAADYHDAVEVPLGAGKGSLWYTGSAHVHNIKEAWSKSFLDLVDGKVTRVPLVTRKIGQFTINSEEDLDAAVKSCAEITAGPTPTEWDISRPIVVVDYLASIPEVESRMRAALADRATFWPRPASVRMELGTDVEVDAGEEDITLTDLLVEVAMPGTDVYELVNDLLLRGSLVLNEKWRGKMGVV